jgi:hypothetical protein
LSGPERFRRSVKIQGTRFIFALSLVVASPSCSPPTPLSPPPCSHRRHRSVLLHAPRSPTPTLPNPANVPYLPLYFTRSRARPHRWNSERVGRLRSSTRSAASDLRAPPASPVPSPPRRSVPSPALARDPPLGLVVAAVHAPSNSTIEPSIVAILRRSFGLPIAQIASHPPTTLHQIRLPPLHTLCTVPRQAPQLRSLPSD